MVIETPPKPAVLTDRERRILDHVFRFRLTTRDVLYKCFFEAHGLKTDAMTSVLRDIAAPYKPRMTAEERDRLARSYHLFPKPLYGKVIYYHLTRLGIRAVGAENDLPPQVLNKLGRGLNHDTRAKRYAILAFCCLAGHRREKITSREFRSRLAEFHIPGCPTDAYYFDMDQSPPRLGFMRLDYARTRPDACLAKCADDVVKRLANDHFRKRADQGLFVVSLLTPTEPRKELLEKSRATLETRVASRIEIHHVPQLDTVLLRGQRG